VRLIARIARHRPARSARSARRAESPRSPPRRSAHARKPARRGRDRLGLGVHAHGDLGDDPERALRADEEAREVVTRRGLRARVPVRTTVPSASTTVSASTFSRHRAVAHRVRARGARRGHSTDRRVGARIEREEETGAFSASLSCFRVTPGCTTGVEILACTARNRVHLPEVDRHAPRTASTCPSTELPTPYGIIARRARGRGARSRPTSSVDWGNATASGGIGANADSSRPCCTRTLSPVDTRSPRSVRRPSSTAAAGGDGRCRARSWLATKRVWRILRARNHPRTHHQRTLRPETRHDAHQ